jgi:hypothetical protein
VSIDAERIVALEDEIASMRDVLARIAALGPVKGSKATMATLASYALRYRPSDGETELDRSMRILRQGVPDSYKNITDAVGATQAYVADLERKLKSFGYDVLDHVRGEDDEEETSS